MGVVEERAVDVRLAVASPSQGQGVSAGRHVNSDKLRGELYSGSNSGFRRSWLPAPNCGWFAYNPVLLTLVLWRMILGPPLGGPSGIHCNCRNKRQITPRAACRNCRSRRRGRRTLCPGAFDQEEAAEQRRKTDRQCSLEQNVKPLSLCHAKCLT